MPTVQQIAEFLELFAPTSLAETWDNVGLLVGDPQNEVDKLMTCLTITPETVAEAIERSAQLIVTHHPLPFQSFKRITTETIPGSMLWHLIRAGISIYSPHTGFDSALAGINQRLAQMLGLNSIQPIKPMIQPTGNGSENLGAGRWGQASYDSLANFIESIKLSLGLKQILFTGDLSAACGKVAVACGSGGSFLNAAADLGCDTFVTGETNFHTCLEAKAKSISLVMLGHYASERFAVEYLAETLVEEFAITVWASQREEDPVQFA